MGGGSTVLAGENNVDIATIVGLAPAETNPSAITAAANVSVPAIIFSGESDAVTPPQDHHIPIYNALGSSCKYFINILDGSHCYFANSSFTCELGESSPGSLTRVQQHDVVNDMLTLWFDYTLRNNTTAMLELNYSLYVSQRISFNENCVASSVNQQDLADIRIWSEEQELYFSSPILEGFSIVEIFDINGRFVKSRELFLENGRGKTDLTSTSPRVYIFRLSVGSRYFIKKIIVR